MSAPYPADWERQASTRDGLAFRVRPIRPDDADRERCFIRRLSPQSRYQRMMNAMRELPPDLLQRFVHVDYIHDMAFVAVTGDPPNEELIGVARYAQDRSGPDCEFAVVVADAWQARGVGATLMGVLFEYAHARGVHRLHGEILADNAHMIDLAHWLGMQTKQHDQDQCLVQASREI
jgi:acetyltransferase